VAKGGSVYPAGNPSLPRLAAIDIGTNSIRLAVAEVDADGSYRLLDEEREMTRLGRGLYSAGRLGEAPMEQSLQALGKMKAIAEGFDVAELRVIATRAVREAVNGRDFVREAWRRHRVRIEVVPAEEEARLAFRSVSRHYDLDDRLTAIVDIGGGSTEVILAAGGLVEQVVSLPLGAVRLSETYAKSDPLRPKHWKALRDAIDLVIEKAIGKPPFAAPLMIGSGGTFTNLGDMAQAEREGKVTHARDYALSRAEITRMLDRLRETPLEARRRIPGLNPQRADIILGGVAIVARLTKWLGTQRVLVNDRAVRDGVLLSMIDERAGVTAPAKEQPPDRFDAVRRFARMCRSNERHCEHVAALAAELFDALRDAYALPAGWDVPRAAALLLYDSVPDQPRGASQARVPPDHARRPAGVFSAGSRADRQRRPLSPARGPEASAPHLRRPRKGRASPGAAPRGNPAGRGRPRPGPQPGRLGRALPDRRWLDADSGRCRPQPVHRAGRREAKGRFVRTSVLDPAVPLVAARHTATLACPSATSPPTRRITTSTGSCPGSNSTAASWKRRRTRPTPGSSG
jgi:exopolyphosphatase/guanosine-5'-triphosphate,3'-diphosphate pyrophosphatase